MARRSDKFSEVEKQALNRTTIRRLGQIFRYIAPHRAYFIGGLISLFLSSVTLLSFPWLAGKLLDVAQGQPSIFSSINEVTLALIGVLLVTSVFSFLRVYTFAIVNERGMADLRKTLYEKIIWLPMTFFDSRRVGDLMSRVTADVGVLQETFSFTLAELLRQLWTLAGGIVILFVLTPTLTLFMLLTFPVIVIAAIIFGKFIRKLSKKTQEQLARANVIVEESFQSISTVKAFTNEALESQRYSTALTSVIKVAIRSSRYRGFFISFIIFAIFGGIVAVGWYGANLVASGGLTIGELFSFILYTSFVGFSIAGLGDIYAQLQRAAGAADRVLEILGMHDERQPAGPAMKLKGALEFRNVRFSYPTRKDFVVLHDLNFSVRPGEKVALVGPSGSGKSTIINLLTRYYPLTDGEIFADGKNIRDYQLTSYRANIGIVPQDVVLFGGTILENIRYGKPGAGFEEVRAAAAKANALAFIESFPEKFDTLVGDRGVKLSGGQRQRVAIARAILKDPSILILDEATSSLDVQSEALVQEALEKLMQGRTTIVIAHRLSTIKKVDRIFVIKEGSLAETGSHVELTARDNGVYSNLLKLQLQ